MRWGSGDPDRRARKESILIDSGWPGLDDRDPRRIVHVLKDLAGCDHLDHLVTHTGTSTTWRRCRPCEARRNQALLGPWLPEDNDPRLDFPDGPKADDPLGIAYREASKGKRSALKAGDSIPFEATSPAWSSLRGQGDPDPGRILILSVWM